MRFMRFLFFISLLLSFLTTASGQVIRRTEFFFPQLADGKINDEDEFRTLFVLNNPGDTTATGKLELFGDNGSPMTVQFQDASGKLIEASEIKFTIPAKGVFQIISAGAHRSTIVGYGKVTSDMPISGSATFVKFNIKGSGGFTKIKLQGEAGVEATGGLRTFATTDFRVDKSSTGLAIVNTSRTAFTTIMLKEFDASGKQIDQAMFAMAPGAHRAFFLSEVLTHVPKGLVNGVVVESAETDVSAIAIKFDHDEDDQDEFTAVPVIQLKP